VCKYARKIAQSIIGNPIWDADDMEKREREREKNKQFNV
jgi:hypothetical protein